MESARAWGACVLALCVSTPAGAMEVRGMLGGWGYHMTGTTTANGATYDLENDLELHASRRRSALVEWDTSPGWWPDVAASYSQIGGTGQNSGSFSVGPLPPMNRTIAASGRF